MVDTVRPRQVSRQLRHTADRRTVGDVTDLPQRIPCVGAVVRDDDGRLLLVRRANEPGRGLWSVPGGRVEAGETAEQAVVREVAEETGLQVVVTGLAGVVERAAPGGGVFVIEDHTARLAPGTSPQSLQAGDDALAASWVDVEELDRVPCVEGLLEALRDWGCLPAAPRSATP
jgi:ADP-ribose pyrophosphatase YjhB (NUDIX family)